MDLVDHTSVHTTRESRVNWDHIGEAAGERYKLPVPYLHSVWGHMVPEIPAFRRELVAALAES